MAEHGHLSQQSEQSILDYVPSNLNEALTIENADNPILDVQQCVKSALNSKANYFDTLQAILGAWERLPRILISPFAVSSENTVQHCLKYLFIETARFVLNAEWRTISEDIRKRFFALIEQCSPLVQRYHTAFDLCKELCMLQPNPWSDSILGDILNGEDILNPMQVHAYVGSQLSEVLRVRIEVLAKSHCKDLAENLCRSCLQSRTLSKDPFYKDFLLYLLHRQNKVAQIYEEIVAMSCSEGVQLICRMIFREEKGYFGLATTLSLMFLLRELNKPCTCSCTKAFVSLWCGLQAKQTGSLENFLCELRKLITFPSTSSQFYSLVSAIQEQYLPGDHVLPICLELYMRGLTVDQNELEMAVHAESSETIATAKEEMAKVYRALVHLLRNHKVVARECALTEFFLLPDEKKLNELESLYSQSEDPGGGGMLSSSLEKIITPLQPQALLTGLEPQPMLEGLPSKLASVACKCNDLNESPSSPCHGGPNCKSELVQNPLESKDIVPFDEGLSLKANGIKKDMGQSILDSQIPGMNARFIYDFATILYGPRSGRIDGTQTWSDVKLICEKHLNLSRLKKEEAKLAEQAEKERAEKEQLEKIMVEKDNEILNTVPATSTTVIATSRDVLSSNNATHLLQKPLVAGEPPSSNKYNSLELNPISALQEAKPATHSAFYAEWLKFCQQKSIGRGEQFNGALQQVLASQKPLKISQELKVKGGTTLSNPMLANIKPGQTVLFQQSLGGSKKVILAPRAGGSSKWRLVKTEHGQSDYSKLPSMKKRSVIVRNRKSGHHPGNIHVHTCPVVQTKPENVSGTKVMVLPSGAVQTSSGSVMNHNPTSSNQRNLIIVVKKPVDKSQSQENVTYQLNGHLPNSHGIGETNNLSASQDIKLPDPTTLTNMVLKQNESGNDNFNLHLQPMHVSSLSRVVAKDIVSKVSHAKNEATKNLQTIPFQQIAHASISQPLSMLSVQPQYSRSSHLQISESGSQHPQSLPSNTSTKKFQFLTSVKPHKKYIHHLATSTTGTTCKIPLQLKKFPVCQSQSITAKHQQFKLNTKPYQGTSDLPILATESRLQNQSPNMMIKSSQTQIPITQTPQLQHFPSFLSQSLVLTYPMQTVLGTQSQVSCNELIDQNSADSSPKISKKKKCVKKRSKKEISTLQESLFSETENLTSLPESQLPVKIPKPKSSKIIFDGPKPQCIFCQKEFASTYNLKRHYKACHPDNEIPEIPEFKILRDPNSPKLEKPKIPRRCKDCNGEFSTVTLLRKHRANVHGIIPTKVVKKSTDSQLPNQSNSLKETLVSDISTGGLVLVKSEIPEVKPEIQAVNSEMPLIMSEIPILKSEHPRIPNPVEKFCCIFCQKEFPTRYSFKRHSEVYHAMCVNKLKLKKNEVSTASPKKKSNSSSSNKQPCKTIEKKHPCPECNTRYCSNYSVRRHMMAVHQFQTDIPIGNLSNKTASFKPNVSQVQTNIAAEVITKLTLNVENNSTEEKKDAELENISVSEPVNIEPTEISESISKVDGSVMCVEQTSLYNTPVDDVKNLNNNIDDEISPLDNSEGGIAEEDSNCPSKPNEIEGLNLFEHEESSESNKVNDSTIDEETKQFNPSELSTNLDLLDTHDDLNIEMDEHSSDLENDDKLNDSIEDSDKDDESEKDEENDDESSKSADDCKNSSSSEKESDDDSKSEKQKNLIQNPNQRKSKRECGRWMKMFLKKQKSLAIHEEPRSLKSSKSSSPVIRKRGRPRKKEDKISLSKVIRSKIKLMKENEFEDKQCKTDSFEMSNRRSTRLVSKDFLICRKEKSTSPEQNKSPQSNKSKRNSEGSTELSPESKRRLATTSSSELSSTINMSSRTPRLTIRRTDPADNSEVNRISPELINKLNKMKVDRNILDSSRTKKVRNIRSTKRSTSSQS